MFWNIFYDLCKSKGTSPTAVCLEIGLSNAAATGWKNGTLPKADVLVKIANHLGCSVDYLLGIQTPPEPITLRASEKEWLFILNQMSDENLLKLRDYTRYLLWLQSQAAEDSPESQQ